jgi:hypothetical protein
MRLEHGHYAKACFKVGIVVEGKEDPPDEGVCDAGG